MPITFQTEPANRRYLNIYNPAVYEFRSDDPAQEATFQIAGSALIKRTPIGTDSSFYFDASESFRSWFGFDFTDPLENLEDTANSFVDSNLSLETTLSFAVGAESIGRAYTLFQSAQNIGSRPLPLENRFTLKIADRIPYIPNDYQEVAVYVSRGTTIRGIQLRKGVNRIRLKTFDDARIIEDNFGITPVPHFADGIRIKYFSRGGSWVYLRGECAGAEILNVQPGSIIPTTRQNIAQEQTKFRQLGKNAQRTFRVPLSYLFREYIDDLLLSPGVFINLDNKWQQASLTTSAFQTEINDELGRIILDFVTSPIDTLTQI